MIEIGVAIGAAINLGLIDTRPSIRRVMIPCGQKMWHQPATQRVVRNEGGKLPYAVYNIDGTLIDRVALKRHASSYEFYQGGRI